MRKHYGQVVKTCIKITFASALLLVISGVLSYAIKGKVIAILEIIAGIIAFCAVIFIRNKRKVTEKYSSLSHNQIHVISIYAKDSGYLKKRMHSTCLQQYY